MRHPFCKLCERSHHSECLRDNIGLNPAYAKILTHGHYPLNLGFEGLTIKPPCDACAQASDLRPEAPCPPPPRLVPTRGRHRQVDTATQFCPNPDCAYRGWVGWGNLRANGHPNGGPWRQLRCVACRHYFLETLGTIFHGKRVSVELIVRVIACLAEGLGIRGTARVFEVDP